MTAVSSVWLSGDVTVFARCNTLRDVKALTAATKNKYYSSVLTFDCETTDLLLDDRMSPPPALLRVLVLNDDDTDNDNEDDNPRAYAARRRLRSVARDVWVQRLVAHATARDPTIWRRAYEQMAEEGRGDWRDIVNTALLEYVSSRSWQLHTVVSFLKAGAEVDERQARKRTQSGGQSGEDVVNKMAGDGPVIFFVAEKCFRALAVMRRLAVTTATRFNDIPFNLYDDTTVIFGHAVGAVVLHTPAHVYDANTRRID
eukprot:GEMP01006291.1.p1 GENE.GEMP01006291.1~~GEMP01006291.1.p1  ORF type:complete len:257 (+),score=76.49 GEMP01006291.1:132-902(+)